jgi:hypothetical protein
VSAAGFGQTSVSTDVPPARLVPVVFINLNVFNREASAEQGEALCRAVEFLKLPPGSPVPSHLHLSAVKAPSAPPPSCSAAMCPWTPTRRSSSSSVEEVTRRSSSSSVEELTGTEAGSQNIPVIRPEPTVESPLGRAEDVFDAVLKDFG